ncbi:MAG: hypothetical protein A2X79_03800 [Desulfuromonadaceae bacterium GWB2_53_15]|nr:MAG: hypothetical protein A2X79_03800 [Desulfuromonadaceae bacterium GWB2_53_15]
MPCKDDSARSTDHNLSVPADDLRRRAEETAGTGQDLSQDALPPEKMQQLLHELELQNEELRRTQHELECSRARYFSLYDLAPIGYLTLNEEGLILEANLTIATQLGMPRGALLKQPLTRFILPGDQDIYYLQRKQCLESDAPQAWEMRMMSVDGYTFWAYLQATPQQNGEHWITLNNITKRKQAEEALAQKRQQLEDINRSLETRISAAVVEMHTKDDMLIQQGRLAAMGEMISNIAHQWRQPLNNLGLIVQDLRLSYELGEMTVEEMDQSVAKAMGVILYMSSTIDDFRNFFSYEKEPRGFTVNQVVSRALNFVSPALKCSGISVELDEQPDISALGNPNEYLQALLNILNNAKDVLIECKTDDPLISIRIFRDNDRSIVTIRDNGGGIKEDILPKIFDPYFTTKGLGNGTGIGLYMSKAIIEKNMAGRLSAYNAGGGAEFRIEI